MKFLRFLLLFQGAHMNVRYRDFTKLESSIYVLCITFPHLTCAAGALHHWRALCVAARTDLLSLPLRRLQVEHPCLALARDELVWKSKIRLGWMAFQGPVFIFTDGWGRSDGEQRQEIFRIQKSRNELSVVILTSLWYIQGQKLSAETQWEACALDNLQNL